MSRDFAGEQRIPKGWMVVKLREVVQPRGEKVSPQDFPDAPFLGMKNVEAHTSRIIATEPAKNFSSHASRFYAGDVLYGRLRPYLNKVVRPQFDGLASGEFIVLPENALIDGSFLKYRLISGDFVSFASHLNEGDRPRVNFKQIGEFQLLLPPLDEQHRIVAKIEELFSQLDAGVAALEQARAQIKRYRQALLKAAFQGRLTADWRRAHAGELEPADALLARIRAEREARWQAQLAAWEEAVRAWEAAGKPGRKPRKPRKPKDLPPLTEEELAALPELPEGWAWTHVANVSIVGTGVTPLKKNRKYYEDGNIPWVTSGALNSPVVTQPSGYVTKAALDETNLRLYPVGTLLVAMYGEGKTRGKCSELRIESTINQAIAALVQTGLESETRKYLKWFLVKNYNDIRLRSSGGVQPNLNLGIIESTILPICPLEEQRELVRQLETQFSAIDHLDQTIEQALARAGALRQAILKRAFAGRLVPQDPNDEPAGELLTRVQAERQKV